MDGRPQRRIALAVILLIHGVAHLPGFVVPWRRATLEEMAYKSTLLAGRVDVGDVGIRALVSCGSLQRSPGVCAIGVLTRAAWWKPAILIAGLFSLFLSVAGWPDARIGVFVNLAILALLLVNRQAGWLR